jgi:hypothetical protein
VFLTFLLSLCLLPAKDSIDLNQIIDQTSYLEETVFNALRIFGEEKHDLGYNFDTGSISDQSLCCTVLAYPNKEGRKQKLLALSGLGKRPRYNEVFSLFVDEAQKLAGVSVAKPFEGMAYKPIQSLFNKMYVRRGQMSLSVIGDLQRGTMYVETPEDLDRIKRTLSEAYQDNLDRKIDGMGDFAGMLAAIGACAPMELMTASGEAVKIMIYRIKDNSSQQERTDRGELSHVMNINFFIDGPQADCCRNATIIGACELQVGVLSTLNSLRGNHLPYERQRILDGMPHLKHVLESTPFNKGESDIEQINKSFDQYHHFTTTHSITLTHMDGVSHASSNSWDQTFVEGHEPTFYCLNHGRINEWRNPYSKNRYDTMQIWTCDVDPSHRYVVESLAVNIRDQGWGNVGVNIALLAVVENFTMEIASRALQDGERELHALELVKDSFNFSRFMFSSFLPPGTRQVIRSFLFFTFSSVFMFSSFLPQGRTCRHGSTS